MEALINYTAPCEKRERAFWESLNRSKINRTFPRRKMIIPSLNYLWEADTAVMTSYDEENDNYRYFLLVVNAFSKYVWTTPLKSTKGIEMVSALSSVLDGN